MTEVRHPAGGAPIRDVPVDWEALEDAFENNAPEVHSYLHLTTGEVLRVVDGVADPQMHSRISSDPNYLRIDPVSSREQYRWMERFIPMVDEGELKTKLSQAIDGKGAFRRFKDVLLSYPVERDRWFTYRANLLHIYVNGWLDPNNPSGGFIVAPEYAPGTNQPTQAALDSLFPTAPAGTVGRSSTIYFNADNTPFIQGKNGLGYNGPLNSLAPGRY